MPERGYHDIGGADFGPVLKEEPPLKHWEWESEGIRSLMGSGRHHYLTLDELRRVFETFGEDLYERGFHERRVESMIHLLVEKGVIAHEEFDSRLAELTVKRPGAL